MSMPELETENVPLVAGVLIVRPFIEKNVLISHAETFP
jgi:hypothetical protein